LQLLKKNRFLATKQLRPNNLHVIKKYQICLSRYFFDCYDNSEGIPTLGNNANLWHDTPRSYRLFCHRATFTAVFSNRKAIPSILCLRVQD